MLGVLLLVSITLVLLDVRGSSAIGGLRGLAATVIGPVETAVGAAAAPFVTAARAFAELSVICVALPPRWASYQAYGLSEAGVHGAPPPRRAASGPPGLRCRSRKLRTRSPRRRRYGVHAVVVGVADH